MLKFNCLLILYKSISVVDLKPASASHCPGGHVKHRFVWNRSYTSIYTKQGHQRPSNMRTYISHTTHTNKKHSPQQHTWIMREMWNSHPLQYLHQPPKSTLIKNSLLDFGRRGSRITILLFNIAKAQESIAAWYRKGWCACAIRVLKHTQIHTRTPCLYVNMYVSVGVIASRVCCPYLNMRGRDCGEEKNR